MADAWLVAGLGNPGERYERTRHNAGVMVVDRLCERLGVRRRKVRFIPVEAVQASHAGTPLLLVVSQRYMNESGPSIASFARKRDVPAGRIVVVHDELDLPFGVVKVKAGGGAAGHRGVESLIQALRSREFARVRVGIGRPPGRQDPVDFVLESFRRAEDVDPVIERAADAALALVEEGLERAQERFNRGTDSA